MGGVVPAGESNEELVDNLVEAEYITKPDVEAVFRQVDRGDYILITDREDERLEAYQDSAWRKGTLHLSAPCIYTRALEALNIQPGSSFLNIGSGTGYFSTMVAMLIGSGGTNHGVEIYKDNVEYARKKIEEFKNNNAWYDPIQFCEPYFCVGNGLLISEVNRKYDKIYCGAACTGEAAQLHLKNLLEIGGLLVMPTESQLVAVTRVSEEEWSTHIVLSSVAFSPLILPSGEKPEDLMTFTIDAEIPALKDLCKRSTLKRLTRGRYGTIDHLPLPTPIKTYLKSGREWEKPCPLLKKMCPYKKEKLCDEMSEEENMACGVEPSPRSRRHRDDGLRVKLTGRQRMIICNLNNGITVQIPLLHLPSEEQESNSELEESVEEDGDSPYEPHPTNQMVHDDHNPHNRHPTVKDDCHPKKKKKRSLLKFRSKSREDSDSDCEEEDNSELGTEEAQHPKLPKKEGFLRKLFKRNSTSRHDKKRTDTPEEDMPTLPEVDTPTLPEVDTPTLPEEDTPTLPEGMPNFDGDFDADRDKSHESDN